MHGNSHLNRISAKIFSRSQSSFKAPSFKVRVYLEDNSVVVQSGTFLNLMTVIVSSIRGPGSVELDFVERAQSITG